MEILGPKTAEQTSKKRISFPLAQRLRGFRNAAMASLVVTSLMTACGNVAAVESPTATPAPTPATEPTIIPSLTPTPNEADEPVITSGFDESGLHQISPTEAYQLVAPINQTPNKSGERWSCRLEPYSFLFPMETNNLPRNTFLVTYKRPTNPDFQLSSLQPCPTDAMFFVKLTDPQHPSTKIRGINHFTPQLRQHLPTGISERVAQALLPDAGDAPLVTVLNDSISNGRRTFKRNDRGYVEGDQEDNSWCVLNDQGKVQVVNIDTPTSGKESLSYTRPNPDLSLNPLNRNCPTGTIFYVDPPKPL